MKRARTPQAKEHRRQALLGAALDEFYEKGLTAARSDDIAERAGLSKGTLYVYFSSKEDLFKALIDNLTSPKLAMLEAIVDEDLPIEEALARFGQLIPVIVQQSDMPRLLKILVGESQQFPDVVKLYRINVIERVLSLLTRLLDGARRRQEITVDDPSIAARLLVAPVLFCGLWQALFAGDRDARLDVSTLIATHLRLFLSAVRKEKRQ